MADQWLYRLFGEEFGPVSRTALDGLIAAGQLASNDEIRAETSSSWVTVRTLMTSPENGDSRIISGRSSQGGGTVVSFDSLNDFELLDDAVSDTSATVAAAPEGWYYQSLGQEWGPVPFEELEELARTGQLEKDDQIRTGVNGKWRRAGSMGRLIAAMPYQAQLQQIGSAGKSTQSDNDKDPDSRFLTRETPPPATRETPPSIPTHPVATAPPPPPPPPMMPAPAYPAYAPPAPPMWGYSQPMAPAPMVDQGWYAWLGGVECGPMEWTQLANWASSNRLSAQDYVKQGRYSQWSQANSIPGLIPSTPLPAAPPPVMYSAPTVSAPAVAPAAPAAVTPRMPVQIPTPPSQATLATPAPATPAPATAAPAAVKPAIPVPRPVAPPPKPDFPSDAPPERPPANDWNSPSASSSFGGGMGSSSPMMGRSAFTPPKKSPPPRKGSKKSSSGGSLDIGAVLKDSRVLGGFGAVVLIGLLGFGYTMLPEGTGKLVEAHKQYTAIYEEVEKMAAENPPEKDWAAFGKKIKDKTKPIGLTLSKSKHPAKNSLSSAKTALDGAANVKAPKEAEKKLQDAKKKLDDAKKKLGI